MVAPFVYDLRIKSSVVLIIKNAERGSRDLSNASSPTKCQANSIGDVFKYGKRSSECKYLANFGVGSWKQHNPLQLKKYLRSVIQ